MYIPGLSRTGSRPSRTVMSFAVYVVSVIKKALQIAILRARRSVSETAAGSGPREACRGGSRDRFAQVLVLDRRGQFHRFGPLVEANLQAFCCRFGRRASLGLGH